MIRKSSFWHVPFSRFRFITVVLPLLAMLLLACSAVLNTVRAQDEFLDPEDAFRFSAAMAAPATLDLHYAIAPEYYMYRERFELSAPDGVLVDTLFPPGLVKYDPTFDQDMEVYYGQVTLRLQLAGADDGLPLTAGRPLTLAITSQGCADAGLCYPPETRELQLLWTSDGDWKVEGQGAVAGPVPAPLAMVLGGDGKPLEGENLPGSGGNGGGLNPFDFGDTGLAAWLEGAGWIQVVGLCLLLGLLLAFTPCVLPMVPILMAVIAGQTNKDSRLSRGRGLALAAVFVLGMSIVYTALGVVAGLLGSGLMIWLQTPWVLVTFAVLLALLALAMFDVFTLQAPAALQTALHERMNRIPGGRFSGVFLMGMLSALIVGPCVAAPLAGVLLFISQTGDVALGGAALFALAWGSGIPLLLLGASSGMLLPKAGAWMEGVKWGFGILLLATAWWMVSSLLPVWLLMLGWALLALSSAVMMGAFEAVPAGAGPGRHAWKALGIMLAVWALLMLVGMAGGGRDPLRPLSPYVGTGATAVSGAAPGVDLAEAVKRRFVKVDSIEELEQTLAQADRPVMLDFYADWCVSCIEMERFTFSDPDVARKLDGFLLLQADVTANKEAHRALLKRFRLFGPPSIIFFDPQGRELDVRVVGFQNAERFGKSLDQVLAIAGAGTPATAISLPQQDAPVKTSSALLAQQLRGFNGEISENAITTGTLEGQ